MKSWAADPSTNEMLALHSWERRYISSTSPPRTKSTMSLNNCKSECLGEYTINGCLPCALHGPRDSLQVLSAVRPLRIVSSPATGQDTDHLSPNQV